MILSVMQPTYLPWLGYFALIQSADKFVFLDDVKLEKSDWHIRNRIKAKNQSLMLSCHVSTPNGRLAATIENTSFVKEAVWKKKAPKKYL
ncbi:WbqC family protein [Pseudoalteromonas sp. SaAl2]